MIQEELVSLKNYIDDFGVPFIRDFAVACRKHIVISGVKNCFIIKCPLYLPGEIKSSPILFQYKGNHTFECKHDKFSFTFPGDESLKDQLLESIQFVKITDEAADEPRYELRWHMLFPQEKFFSFSFEAIVNGTYRISNANLGIEVELPNVHTRFAVQGLLDFMQKTQL